MPTDYSAELVKASLAPIARGADGPFEGAKFDGGKIEVTPRALHAFATAETLRAVLTAYFAGRWNVATEYPEDAASNDTAMQAQHGTIYDVATANGRPVNLTTYFDDDSTARATFVCLAEEW